MSARTEMKMEIDMHARKFLLFLTKKEFSESTAESVMYTKCLILE